MITLGDIIPCKANTHVMVWNDKLGEYIEVVDTINYTDYPVKRMMKEQDSMMIYLGEITEAE